MLSTGPENSSVLRTELSTEKRAQYWSREQSSVLVLRTELGTGPESIQGSTLRVCLNRLRAPPLRFLCLPEQAQGSALSVSLTLSQWIIAI